MTPLIIFIAFALLFGFLAFIRKLVLKKKLSQGLGREVSDRELTSVSAWMNATAGSAAPSGLPPGSVSATATDSSAEQVVQEKKKSPGKVALIIGLFSLALVFLSIILGRVFRDEFYFWTTYTSACLLIVPGVLLALIALKRVKKNPLLYIGSGRAKNALVVNLVSGCLMISLIAAMVLILPRRYYDWVTSGSPLPSRYSSGDSLAGTATTQPTPTPEIPESAPSELDLSARNALVSLVDLYFATKGMKSDSSLSGTNKSTIVVEVNPVRNQGEANQAFRGLNEYAGKSFRSTGIRKVQITSTQGSWDFDV